MSSPSSLSSCHYQLLGRNVSEFYFMITVGSAIVTSLFALMAVLNHTTSIPTKRDGTQTFTFEMGMASCAAVTFMLLVLSLSIPKNKGT